MAPINAAIKKITDTEKVIQELLRPEFKLKDVVQVIVGATILAIPIGFTEEVWKLGEELPWVNIAMIVAISISFVSIFVYYTYYKNRVRKYWISFARRVSSTYILSIIVVALMLTAINRADWFMFWELSLKRALIIAFPASMSATVADVIK